MVEKPENLIKEDKMIEMMVDIHLAEAAYRARHLQDSSLVNSTSEDFYYAVLEDYQVADSVFENSYIYYASFPRNFEIMYQDVMNRLQELEQEYSLEPSDELNFEIREN